ncbi:MAG: hypothetical protein LBB84_11380 [Tannerellaceae bacterium]|nr:hypothetical protein [Tannerellaceae bacterium]
MRKTLLLSFLFGWGALHAVYAQEVVADPPKVDRIISFTEGGVLAGNSDNQNKAPFIFHSSLNYVLNKRLSAGLGAGVEFMKETHLPLTANIIYSLGNKAAVHPFVRFQGGYLIALESKTSTNSGYYTPLSSSYYPYLSTEMEAKGGWLLNPSAGVIFYTKQKVGIALSVGYRHQKLNYTGKNDYRIQVEQNRLSLTLGLIF